MLRKPSGTRRYGGHRHPGCEGGGGDQGGPEAGGAGDKLDAKKVKAAVLAVGDMPTGWAAGEVGPDKRNTSTVEPASCH